MLIAHLSDAHIGPLPPIRFRNLLGKRLTGYLNWRRGRGTVHDMALLGRIMDHIHSRKPDHIAMTGDIVNIGLPEEFPKAREFLEQLGPPSSVSFVPGNHDAYVTGALDPMQRHLAPWMTGDDGVAGFPYVRRRDSVALIGLSSALPTLPFMATGALGVRQIEACTALLDELGREGLCRIIMIHHPPHIGGARARRGLDDAARFEAMIARVGAELVLHGHNHMVSLARIRGPQGVVPVLGAPSSSDGHGVAGHRAGYHWLDIAPRGNQSLIKIETVCHDAESDTMMPFGSPIEVGGQRDPHTA